MAVDDMVMLGFMCFMVVCALKEIKTMLNCVAD